MKNINKYKSNCPIIIFIPFYSFRYYFDTFIFKNWTVKYLIFKFVENWLRTREISWGLIFLIFSAPSRVRHPWSVGRVRREPSTVHANPDDTRKIITTRSWLFRDANDENGFLFEGQLSANKKKKKIQNKTKNNPRTIQTKVCSATRTVLRHGRWRRKAINFTTIGCHWRRGGGGWCVRVCVRACERASVLSWLTPP